MRSTKAETAPHTVQKMLAATSRENVSRLVDEKRAEIVGKIAELEQFAAQLAEVRVSLDAEPPLAQCRNDLTCCVPEPRGEPVAIALTPRR